MTERAMLLVMQSVGLMSTSRLNRLDFSLFTYVFFPLLLLPKNAGSATQDKNQINNLSTSTLLQILF